MSHYPSAPVYSLVVALLLVWTASFAIPITLFSLLLALPSAFPASAQCLSIGPVPGTGFLRKGAWCQVPASLFLFVRIADSEHAFESWVVKEVIGRLFRLHLPPTLQP